MTNPNYEQLIQRFVEATLEINVDVGREYETIINGRNMVSHFMQKMFPKDDFATKRQTLIESDITPEALTAFDAGAQGIDDEISPDNPREREKVALLQRMVAKMESVMGQRFLLRAIQGKTSALMNDNSPEPDEVMREFITDLIQRKMWVALRPIEDEQYRAADALYDDEKEQDKYLDNIWDETERRLRATLMGE